MIRRTVEAVLHKPSRAVDEWNEETTAWTSELAPVEIATSTSTGAIESTNSVLSINSTHVGLTRDARPETGDKLTVLGHTYLVEYVMNARSYRQLFLSECDEV